MTNSPQPTTSFLRIMLTKSLPRGSRPNLSRVARPMNAKPVAKKAKAKVNRGRPKHLRLPLRKRQVVRGKLGDVIPKIPTRNKPYAVYRFAKQEYAVKKQKMVVDAPSLI